MATASSAKEDRSIFSQLHPEPRFELLKDYFHGIRLNEVLDQSEEQIVACADAKHRILMRAFYRKYLSKLAVNPFEQYEKGDNTSDIKITSSGYVNLRGRVLSSMFQRSKVLVDDHLVPIGVLDDTIRSQAFDETKGVAVDCSSCSLLLSDVVILADKLTQLNCRILDISHNRVATFGDAEERCLVDALHQLLDMKSMQYLNICGNTCASAEATGVFARMQDEHLRKLIWIPQLFLNGNGWKVMVSEPLFEVVRTAHLEYYKDQAFWYS